VGSGMLIFGIKRRLDPTILYKLSAFLELLGDFLERLGRAGSSAKRMPKDREK